MANKVKEIIDDIQFRIKDPLSEIPPAAILRKLNAVYKQFNTEYKALQETLEMDFSTLEEFVAQWARPADMIEVYDIDPFFSYVDAQDWNDDIHGNFYTIEGGYFKFSGIDEDDVVTVDYYSDGLALVNKEDADLSETETNTPAWPERLWDLLIFKTCTELSTTYPHYLQDLKFGIPKLEDALSAFANTPQSKTPNHVGGKPKTTLVDDYGD